MGFLKIFGRQLDFEESKEHFETIRKDAVKKFIWSINSNLNNNNKDYKPKFGFEVNNYLKIII
jgi:hypothetical protein